MFHLRTLLLLVLLSPLALTAQTPKFAVLDAKDPLVGDWEWIKSDTGAPAAPVPDLDWTFIRFSAGTAQSFGALSFDDFEGANCASTFLAFSDGKNITGTLSSSCIAADKGKKFTFAYQYDYGTDRLLITLHGETFYYKRRPQ